jgi:hypothetical protein
MASGVEEVKLEAGPIRMREVIAFTLGHRSLGEAASSYPSLKCRPGSILVSHHRNPFSLSFVSFSYIRSLYLIGLFALASQPSDIRALSDGTIIDFVNDKRPTIGGASRSTANTK